MKNAFEKLKEELAAQGIEVKTERHNFTDVTVIRVGATDTKQFNVRIQGSITDAECDEIRAIVAEHLPQPAQIQIVPDAEPVEDEGEPLHERFTGEA
jgi:hypothetical protein